MKSTNDTHGRRHYILASNMEAKFSTILFQQKAKKKRVWRKYRHAL